ncbi:MAG: hypothetical protein JW981_08880 [Anaerolineae bacterium]|nr:hypothetical protein [Anaerolineae bacterium]
MRKMRLSITILVIWLFLFYNAERINGIFNLTTVAYMMVPLMVFLIILVPKIRALPVWLLTTGQVPVFIILKTFEGSGVWGRYLPLTITEACSIALTIVLTHYVSTGLAEFEQAINHITIGPLDTKLESFSTGQVKMYQELRRARNHQRPLVMVAVGVEDKSIQVALDRMVQEAQQAMMKQYVLSDIAKTLSNQFEDYDIIAHKDDHFILLLPEFSAQELDSLKNWLHDVVAKQLDISLKIGAASFPEDAVTFETLVQKAIEDLDAEAKWDVEFVNTKLTTRPLVTE